MKKMKELSGNKGRNVKNERIDKKTGMQLEKRTEAEFMGKKRMKGIDCRGKNWTCKKEVRRVFPDKGIIGRKRKMIR